MPSERLITIYLAIAANTIIAIAKITVALISGSSVMISREYTLPLTPATNNYCY